MDMSDDLATAMGLKSTPAGVLIEQIEGGSPADKAGLRGSYKPYSSNGEEVLIGGDIITAMDGSNITSMNDLVSALNNHKAGDNVTLTILRDGKESKVAVTLAQKPG
jgi:S1-C subfamily serine protease